ncbi:MAG: thiamine phosphate synthase, partial [Alphaproteobacteria bacterium]|nr:thiamine phosphate synthase [Alphaproteobacteria bacterium]
PVPVVGIGGITADNAGAVREAGADGIAVMRAIGAADDVSLAVRSFLTVQK